VNVTVDQQVFWTKEPLFVQLESLG